MSIKILGGFARGQHLLVPKGDTIRPTSIMLRRRVFDSFQRLDGFVFVDLCAGSGAMGFEAWSRGATCVYLNEMSRHVFKYLEENRETLIIKNSNKNNSEIFCSNELAEKFVKKFKAIYSNFNEEQKKETIIFLDPPYASKSVYFDVLKFLKNQDGEEPWYFGQLWIESDPQKGVPSSAWIENKLSNYKIFEQGESYIYVTIFPQS